MAISQSQTKPRIYKCRECQKWHFIKNDYAMLFPFKTQQYALAFVCGLLHGEFVIHS